MNCYYCGNDRDHHAETCPRRGGMNHRKDMRNGRIVALYRKGKTLKELADSYHLSFQRVHAIIRSAK